jgi:hypothetical protein
MYPAVFIWYEDDKRLEETMTELQQMLESLKRLPPTTRAP